MKTVKGIYAEAKIITDDVEDYAEAQVKMICDNEVAEGSIIRLMPDIHPGKVGPIGLSMTVTDKIIPQLLGVDIGCGMTGAKLKKANIEFQKLDKVIHEKIPSGFSVRKEPHHMAEEFSYEGLHCLGHINRERADRSLGTLGGGNHFIELQEDDNGYLAVMLHSGSRHFGKSVCDYFHTKARELNRRWYSEVPDEYRLAFLPVDTKEGKQYLHWMQLSMDFARENREKMLLAVKAILEKWIGKYTDLQLEFSGDINCHHNYAALENHFGKNVWVHRKGAVRAGNGELAVIPGAMGSYSYVVMGKGNPDSFCSSSHGAGRQYSRKGAMQAFTCEEVILDLQKTGVILGKKNKSDVAEESRFAYKNIEEVMDNQTDLVVPVKRLKTIGVIKG